MLACVFLIERIGKENEELKGKNSKGKKLWQLENG